MQQNGATEWLQQNGCDINGATVQLHKMLKAKSPQLTCNRMQRNGATEWLQRNAENIDGATGWLHQMLEVESGLDTNLPSLANRKHWLEHYTCV